MKKITTCVLLLSFFFTGCKLTVTSNDVKLRTFYAKKNETFVDSMTLSIIELPIYRKILNYCVHNYFNDKDPCVDITGPFCDDVLDKKNCLLVDDGYLAFTLKKDSGYCIGFNMSSVYLSEQELITVMCHELVHCYYPDADHLDEKWRHERNRLLCSFGFDIDKAMSGNIEKYQDY